MPRGHDATAHGASPTPVGSQTPDPRPIDRVPIPVHPQAPLPRRRDAYKAQALFVDHRLQAGEHLIGAKLGLTSRVKREALGIHEPVFGRLTSGMLLPPASRCRSTSSSTPGRSRRSRS